MYPAVCFRVGLTLWAWQMSHVRTKFDTMADKNGCHHGFNAVIICLDPTCAGPWTCLNTDVVSTADNAGLPSGACQRPSVALNAPCSAQTDFSSGAHLSCLQPDILC